MPDGVINDRWLQPTGPRNRVVDALVRGAGDLVQVGWRLLPSGWKQLTFPGANHYDIRTPEYSSFDAIATKKWESTRGVGHSFGANRNERPEDIVTATELIRSFCDIVPRTATCSSASGRTPTAPSPPSSRSPCAGSASGCGRTARRSTRADRGPCPSTDLRGHRGALHHARRGRPRVAGRPARPTHVPPARHRRRRSDLGPPGRRRRAARPGPSTAGSGSPCPSGFRCRRCTCSRSRAASRPGRQTLRLTQQPGVTGDVCRAGSGPHPPPPGVRIRITSPARTSIVHLSGRRSARDLVAAGQQPVLPHRPRPASGQAPRPATPGAR